MCAWRRVLPQAAVGGGDALQAAHLGYRVGVRVRGRGWGRGRVRVGLNPNLNPTLAAWHTLACRRGQAASRSSSRITSLTICLPWVGLGINGLGLGLGLGLRLGYDLGLGMGFE